MRSKRLLIVTEQNFAKYKKYSEIEKKNDRAIVKKNTPHIFLLMHIFFYSGFLENEFKKFEFSIFKEKNKVWKFFFIKREWNI